MLNLSMRPLRIATFRMTSAPIAKAPIAELMPYLFPATAISKWTLASGCPGPASQKCTVQYLPRNIYTTVPV